MMQTTRHAVVIPIFVRQLFFRYQVAFNVCRGGAGTGAVEKVLSLHELSRLRH